MRSAGSGLPLITRPQGSPSVGILQSASTAACPRSHRAVGPVTGSPVHCWRAGSPPRLTRVIGVRPGAGLPAAGHRGTFLGDGDHGVAAPAQDGGDAGDVGTVFVFLAFGQLAPGQQGVVPPGPLVGVRAVCPAGSCLGGHPLVVLVAGEFVEQAGEAGAGFLARGRGHQVTGPGEFAGDVADGGPGSAPCPPRAARCRGTAEACPASWLISITASIDRAPCRYRGTSRNAWSTPGSRLRVSCPPARRISWGAFRRRIDCSKMARRSRWKRSSPARRRRGAGRGPRRRGSRRDGWRSRAAWPRAAARRSGRWHA